MKKKYISKNNIIILILIFSILFYSIFFNYYKYSPTEWLKHFKNLDELNKVSCYSFWWFILTSDIFGLFIYIFPIILVMISCTSFFDIYHTGFFSNIIQRIGYKKMLIYEIIKTWKYALILPIISITTLFISKILYSNNIISKYTETNGYPIQLVNKQMENINSIVFIILHIIIITIFSLIIINTSIIVSRFVKKFYLVNIISFVIVILYENLCNLLIAPLVSKISGVEEMYNGFSLYNLYYLDSIPSLLWEFIYGFVLLIISILGIYIVFRRKERVYLEYE